MTSVQRSEQDMRAFAARYTAAWCSRDPAQVAAMYSLHGSLAVNDGAPSVGRQAIADLARSFMAALPDLHLILDRLEIKENHADYHWTLSGTNSGPGGTGQKICISGFERWQFATDGLIQRSSGHFDAADYEQQLQHGAHPRR